MLGAVQLHADGLGAKFRISGAADKLGNPATFENLTAVSADEARVTVAPTGNTNEFLINQVGPVTADGETINVDVNADGRSGAGEVPITDFIVVTVVAGDAATFTAVIDPEERA